MEERMAEGLNRVMLLGNLGADPELRFGQNAEQAVLRLRLATTESYFDKRSNERKERTNWHNVVVFGKRGEALQKILQKGSTIFIEGRLQTSSYEKDGQKIWRTDIVANNVILAGRGAGRTEDAGAGRSSGGGGRAMPERPQFSQGGGGGGRGGPAPAPAGGFEDDFGPAPSHGDDDDIPF
jgi:single-strand DNA-binding protein